MDSDLPQDFHGIHPLARRQEMPQGIPEGALDSHGLGGALLDDEVLLAHPHQGGVEGQLGLRAFGDELILLREVGVNPSEDVEQERRDDGPSH